MTIAQSFLPEFDNEMANTRKILERVPEASFDWKPHEKSMTLGKLATHVAELPSWLTITVTTEELDLANTEYKSLNASSSQELLNIFDEGVKAAKKTLQQATDEALMQNWKMCNGEQVYFELPKVAVVRSWAFNHLYHHRGQLSVYLRLLNIPVPGMYGPSADEQ